MITEIGYQLLKYEVEMERGVKKSWKKGDQIQGYVEGGLVDLIIIEKDEAFLYGRMFFYLPGCNVWLPKN